jgi:hypothetical protein
MKRYERYSVNYHIPTNTTFPKEARDQPSNGNVERRTDEVKRKEGLTPRVREETSSRTVLWLREKERSLKPFPKKPFMSRQTIHNKSGKKKKTKQALFAFLRHVRIMTYPAAEPS